MYCRHNIRFYFLALVFLWLIMFNGVWGQWDDDDATSTENETEIEISTNGEFLLFLFSYRASNNLVL